MTRKVTVSRSSTTGACVVTVALTRGNSTVKFAWRADVNRIKDGVEYAETQALKILDQIPEPA